MATLSQHMLSEGLPSGRLQWPGYGMVAFLQARPGAFGTPHLAQLHGGFLSAQKFLSVCI